MKAPSISELQKLLSDLPPKRIAEITTRLAKHKKEIKELLTYLLLEADDEESYINRVKEEIDQHFEEINKSNLYFAKKSLRKIARIINKQIRFSAKPTTELELRIYYCKKIKSSNIDYLKSPVLVNLYTNQVKKIEVALEKLHEDLQFDYRREVEMISH
jgi:hypothetical protein